MKTCTTCGAEVHDEANFCNMCGNTFSPTEPDMAAVAEPSAPQIPLLDSANYYTDTGTVPAPTHQHSRIVLAGAAGLVVLAVVAAFLFNPVRRYLGAVREGDAARASEIYADSLADSEKRLTRANDGITAYVNEVLEQYLKRQISYEELGQRLNAVDISGIVPDNLTTAQAQAAQVNDHRLTWESAEAAMASGDYAAALPLYRQVAKSDGEHSADASTKLETVTEAYRTAIVAEAQGLIDDSKFSEAFSVLKAAMDLVPGDADLKHTYATCVETHYDHTVDSIVEEALFLCEQEEYRFALTYLDGMIADYPDEDRLLNARTVLLEGFEEYLYNQAYDLALQGEYAQAAELTAEGLSLFESETVLDLQKICLSHIPVNLGDMEIAVNDTVGGAWNTYTNKTDEYLEDRHGGSYSHSLSVGCGTLTYQVDGLYDRFTGIVSFPKGLVANSSRRSATLTISGDGVQLAVFKNFTSGSSPIRFDLDISQYQQITLKWECKGYNEWKDWGFFATIFDGVFTPIPRQLDEGVG